MSTQEAPGANTSTSADRLGSLSQHLAGPILVAFPLLAVLEPYASVSPGHAGHIFFHRFLAWLSIVPAVVVWVRSDASRHAPPKRYLLFAAIWVLWTPTTLGWAPSLPAAAREIDRSIWCIVAGLAAIALTQGRQSRLAAMRVGWICAFAVTSVIAIWEMVTHDHLIPLVGYKWAFTPDTVVTTFKNPNDYAWFLLACLSIFILGVMRARNWLVRSVYGLLAASSVLLIVPSGSRGAFGVVALMVILSGVWLLQRAGRPAWPTLAKAAVACTAVFIAALFTPPGEALSSRVMAAFQGNAFSDGFRVRLTLTGVRYFIESRGIGAGAGSFEPKVLHDPRAHVAPLQNPHNTFVEMASQYGVIAIIPFLAIFAALIMAIVRSRRVIGQGQQMLDMRMHIVMNLFVVVEASLVSSSVLTDTTWWMLIAYTTALGWQLSRASAEAELADRSASLSSDDRVLENAV